MELFRDCSANEPCVPSFDVIAIAASAGGVQAIGAILAVLPLTFLTPIVVQMHLHPSRCSSLEKVFGARTKLSVEWAEENGALRPGLVTVVPAGKQMCVNKAAQTTLQSGGAVRCKRPADLLFQSVAESFGSRAIAVVLTGCLNDGARGVQLIRKMGGRVLVQDPNEAQASDMPDAAIATGCVDFVMPIQGLTAMLIALVTKEFVEPDHN